VCLWSVAGGDGPGLPPSTTQGRVSVRLPPSCARLRTDGTACA
ncbi:hypothetical protein STRTUCAR8_09852, partial [Streptomyces turgidiscabies Car8]